MRVVTMLALAAMLGVAAENASAQEGALSRLYGNGVHAYFGGDIFGAEKLFTQAIDAGSQDPRCHYYRGLVYLQAGRNKAAAAEFEKGADLEAGATRAYDVSLALERIQGRSRLVLEQHRAAKLATASSATQVQRRQRLESVRRREAVTTVAPTPATLDAITGDAAPIPATRLVPSTPTTVPAASQPEVSAPFADPMKAAPAVSTPAKAAAPPVVAPVAEEADPFGADDALPAEDMPADDAAPADDATPPAEEAPADDEASDPFGGDDASAEDTAAEEEMPAEDAAPADEESDPFGADDTAPAADDAAPAADDAAPAEEAADEADPFGGDDAAADDSSAAEAPADDAAPAADDEEDPFGS